MWRPRLIRASKPLSFYCPALASMGSPIMYSTRALDEALGNSECANISSAEHPFTRKWESSFPHSPSFLDQAQIVFLLVPDSFHKCVDGFNFASTLAQREAILLTSVVIGPVHSAAEFNHSAGSEKSPQWCWCRPLRRDRSREGFISTAKSVDHSSSAKEGSQCQQCSRLAILTFLVGRRPVLEARLVFGSLSMWWGNKSTRI